jgi:hypothetical protein
MTTQISKERHFRRVVGLLAPILLVVGLFPGMGSTASDPPKSLGQTVYVPIYSNIYAGPRSQPVLLTATLSIRNTGQAHPIVVESIKYYDSSGQLLKDYLKTPLRLGPLGSTYVVVDEHDESGGPGAKFIVTWKSDRPVNVPVIQGIMVTTRSGQGISFSTDGHVIKEAAP